MENKHKRQEAASQDKEGILNQFVLKCEEKLVQVATFPFLFT